MVIRDLCIVGDTPNIRLMLDSGKNRQLSTNSFYHLTDGICHVIRDKLTVGAWIGQELLFIQALHQLKGLLRREAVISVCFTLQGC